MQIRFTTCAPLEALCSVCSPNQHNRGQPHFHHIQPWDIRHVATLCFSFFIYRLTIMMYAYSPFLNYTTIVKIKYSSRQKFFLKYKMPQVFIFINNSPTIMFPSNFPFFRACTLSILNYSLYDMYLGVFHSRLSLVCQFSVHMISRMMTMLGAYIYFIIQSSNTYYYLRRRN